MRYNTKLFVFFRQILKESENIYKDIAGFVKSYEKFGELCREAEENVGNIYIYFYRYFD